MNDISPPTSAHRHDFERVGADGGTEKLSRAVADEVPVALEYNGLGYAVLMTTPADLEDLAYGFSRSERLIESAADILGVDCHQTNEGQLVRITLAPDKVDPVVERVRHRVSESSCGLCGIESLEQALRPLPRVIQTSSADRVAIFRSLAALEQSQPLNAATGAVHAAALVSASGQIRLVREDIGRHNAFDKLLGTMLRQGLEWDGGFALLSSRCSFELVEKAVLADCPLLVTISAPTGLAIARAREAGLRLAVLARSDSLLLDTLQDERATVAS